MNYCGKMKLAHDFQMGRSLVTRRHNLTAGTVRDMLAFKRRQAGAYGTWLLPDGSMYEVDDAMGHIRVLTRLFNNQRIQANPTYTEAQNHGFIRIVYHPLTINMVEATPIQKSKLMDLVIESSEDKLSLSIKSHFWILDRREEIDRIEDRIRAAGQRSASDYGAWLKPDGTIIPVHETFGHDKVIRKVITDPDLSEQEMRREALRSGFVRVVYHPFAIEMRSATPDQKSKLMDMVFDTSEPEVQIEFRLRHERFDRREEMDEIEDRIRVASMKKASVYHSGDHGSWILPDGKIYRVIDRYKHKEVAIDIFKQMNIIPKEGRDPIYFARDNLGFIRVTNEPLVFDYTQSPSSAQKTAMMDMVMDYHGAENQVYFNTDIMRVFNRKTEMREMEKFIRRASIKKAGLFFSGDYGSWISPSGKLHRVHTAAGHEDIIPDVLKQEGIRVEEDSEQLLSYDAREKFGFVRVINDPLTFNFTRHLTSAQKSVMLDLVDEYRGVAVYLDTAVVYKDYDKYEQRDRIEGFLRAASNRRPQIAKELLMIARELIGKS